MNDNFEKINAGNFTPTLTPEQLHRGNDLKPYCNLLSLKIREDVHNAIAYGATKAYIYGALMRGSRWLVFAHNGQAMANQEDVISSLRMATSGGRGVIGAGGKLAGLAQMPNPSEAEIVHYSKCINGDVVAVSAKITNGNDLVPMNVSNEYVESIQDILGVGLSSDWHDVDDITVVYLAKLPNDEKSRILPDVIAMASQICDDFSKNIEIVYGRNPLGKDDSLKAMIQEVRGKRVTTSDTGERIVKSGRNIVTTALSADTYRDLYCEFKTEFNLSRQEITLDNVVVNFDATVAVELYPGICGDGTTDSLAYVNKDACERYGKNWLSCSHDAVAPSAKVFLYSRCHDVENYPKNISRLNKDPYWCTPYYGNVFSNLGIKNGRHKYDDLETVYPEVTEFLKSVERPMVRRPFVILRVYIDRINSITSGGNSLSYSNVNVFQTQYYIGQITEMFFSNNPGVCRDICNKLTSVVWETEPEGFKEFRENYKRIFPQTESKRLPLPITYDEILGLNKKIKVRILNQKGEVLKKWTPGESLGFCRLEFTDGREITNKTVISASHGLDITTSDKKWYKISLTKLMRLSDGQNPPVEITPEEYTTSDREFPRKYLYIEVNGQSFQLDGRVDVPKCRAPGGGKGFGAKLSTSEDDKQFYESMESHVPFVKWSAASKHIVFNTTNSLISEIVEFPFQEDDKLGKQVQSYLIRIIKIADRIWDSIDGNVASEFNKSSEQHRKEYDDDASMYMLNVGLEYFFDEENNFEFSSLLKNIRQIAKQAT